MKFRDRLLILGRRKRSPTEDDRYVTVSDLSVGMIVRVVTTVYKVMSIKLDDPYGNNYVALRTVLINERPGIPAYPREYKCSLTEFEGRFRVPTRKQMKAYKNNYG